MADVERLCGTCKHFEPFQSPRFPVHGSCGRWQQGYARDETVPENGVLVENDEGWAMIMGPKFGCVLWEKADG